MDSNICLHFVHMFENSFMVKSLSSERLKWVSVENGNIPTSQLLDESKLKSVEPNEIQLVYTLKSVF
jgi:hypothetical protein